MSALRVLHVDDEPDIRKVVELSLGLDPEFATRSCDSGQEALAVVANWSPDIILLDVMMPVMDGPAILAQLRGNTQTARLPVVFMTARAQTREINFFRSLGAIGVIPKPFDPMTLAASVRSCLQKADDDLDASRNGFLERIEDNATNLIRHRFALRNETASLAVMAEISDIAHGLADASGIFGFPEMGNAAAALVEAVLEHDGSSSFSTIADALDHLVIRTKTSSRPRHRVSYLRFDG